MKQRANPPRTPACRTQRTNGLRKRASVAFGAIFTINVFVMAPALSVQAPAQADQPCGGSHWVAAWTAAPSDAMALGSPNLQPALVVGGQSFRMIITPHSPGSLVRVHLTNRFGHAPVMFAHVTLATDNTGASLDAGSLRTVTFRGHRSITLAPGDDVISDPVQLAVRAFQPVAISYFIPKLTVLPTEHFNANQTSYYTLPNDADLSTSASAGAFQLRATSWYWVDGLDVRAPARVNAVVAIGDSITDGFVGSSPAPFPASSVQVDQNVRYPDFLQRRLNAAHLPLVVDDEGIAGNRVLRPGLLPQFGPSAISRIDSDAADVPGATNAVILEGINDLGQPPLPSASQLEKGYLTLIRSLHAKGMRVLLGTIMPSGSAILDGPLTSPGLEATRQRVNAWIRSQRASDGIVDFDKAMRSSSDPERLNPAYAGSDNLHPNPIGYQVMADAVPLHALSTACGPAPRYDHR